MYMLLKDLFKLEKNKEFIIKHFINGVLNKQFIKEWDRGSFAKYYTRSI